MGRHEAHRPSAGEVKARSADASWRRRGSDSVRLISPHFPLQGTKEAPAKSAKPTGKRKAADDRRNNRNPTTYAFLHGVTLTPMFTGNTAGIPLIVHIAYQIMFAIITPALKVRIPPQIPLAPCTPRSRRHQGCISRCNQQRKEGRRFTLAVVESGGLPAPAVFAVRRFDNRWGIIMSRAEGPTFAHAVDSKTRSRVRVS
jgi:hypothetical protein